MCSNNSCCQQEDNKWSWAKRHTWQSWRERYKNHQLWFDEQIKAYHKKHDIKPNPASQSSLAARKRQAVGASDDETGTPRVPRVAFTEDDDRQLSRHIAKYSLGKEGRQGNVLYKRLVDDVSTQTLQCHNSINSIRQ